MNNTSVDVHLPSTRVDGSLSQIPGAETWPSSSLKLGEMRSELLCPWSLLDSHRSTQTKGCPLQSLMRWQLADKSLMCAGTDPASAPFLPTTLLRGLE